MKGVDGKTGHAPGSYGSIGHGARAPVILYVDCNFASGIDRRRLDGLCRYAAARKWRVETLEHKDCSPAALREALAKFRPIGCATECCYPDTLLRPALFGKVPVVYFDPPDRPAWRDIRSVTCDEAAVAKMAFEELSSTNPPSFAVVSHWKKERWARERIDAFRECCREAGSDCTVSYFPFKCDAEFEDCVGRMVPWVSALPHRCAVFAVNDQCAIAVAKAMDEARRSFPRAMTLVGADGVWQPPWFEEQAKTVSSIRLDHEQAGFLAAKMLGETMGIVHQSSLFTNRQCHQYQPSVPRECAVNCDLQLVNNEDLGFVNNLLSVFPPLLVDRRKSTRGYGRREPRILEAVEMIRREACNGLTAEKLAKRFRGTRRLFDMRFREAMGHPPLDEIMHVRLERVLELLSQPDFPISAIADFSGFSSERMLRKLFRSRFKVSMREGRKARL